MAIDHHLIGDDHLDLKKEMVLTATVEQMRENYCFYIQQLMPSGEVFYAGICKLRDVFTCPDAYKNTHWRATINDQSTIRTTVMATSDKENEVHNELSSFLKLSCRPTANAKGFQQSGSAAITCTLGPNAGKSYATQDRAAIENGISQPSLSNHLNGRRGYETVRGMKFRRGLA